MYTSGLYRTLDPALFMDPALDPDPAKILPDLKSIFVRKKKLNVQEFMSKLLTHIIFR